MAEGTAVKRTGVSVWSPLLLVPALVAAALLIPRLGEQEQGLLPEIIGSHVAYSEEFFDFAAETRRWGTVSFGISCLLGIAFWTVTRNGWKKRLRRFQAALVMNYRTFMFGHTAFAMIAAALAAAALLLASSQLRTMPLVNWIILVAICGLLAAFQHFMTVLGITATRRLYRGR